MLESDQRRGLLGIGLLLVPRYDHRKGIDFLQSFLQGLLQNKPKDTVLTADRRNGVCFSL